MKIQGILSKYEAPAIARKIYRLAHTINPPLDGGPAALHTAGGFSRGNPLSRSLPSFCRHRKKGPAGEAVEEMPFKITEKGIERNKPHRLESPRNILPYPCLRQRCGICVGILFNQYEKSVEISHPPYYNAG